MSKHQCILLLMGNNEVEAHCWLQGLSCTRPEGGGSSVRPTGHRRRLASINVELASGEAVIRVMPGEFGRSTEHRFYCLARGQFSTVMHDVPFGVRKGRFTGRIHGSHARRVRILPTEAHVGPSNYADRVALGGPAAGSTLTRSTSLARHDYYKARGRVFKSTWAA